MNYRPKNFSLQELVPPTTFDRLGEGAWNLLSEPALRSLQAIRDRFGPVTVNDWHRGGLYRESGFREMNTTTGAPKSAHKRGEAFDLKFPEYTVREVYDYILDNSHEFPYIRRMENIESTRTWLHFDVVEHTGKGIRVFKP